MSNPTTLPSDIDQQVHKIMMDFRNTIQLVAPTTIEDWEFSGIEVLAAAKRAAGLQDEA